MGTELSLCHRSLHRCVMMVMIYMMLSLTLGVTGLRRSALLVLTPLLTAIHKHELLQHRETPLQKAQGPNGLDLLTGRMCRPEQSPAAFFKVNGKLRKLSGHNFADIFQS